jgi:hypothetical protein
VLAQSALSARYWHNDGGTRSLRGENAVIAGKTSLGEMSRRHFHDDAYDASRAVPVL